MSSRTTLCTDINETIFEDFRKKWFDRILYSRPSDPLNPQQLPPRGLVELQPELNEYLSVVNYNITEPIVDLLEVQVPGIKNYIMEEIKKNNDEKLESGRKIYTLKYWSAKKVPKKINGELVFERDENRNFKLDENGQKIPEMVPDYIPIFDNSDTNNDTRNGFTEKGIEKGKMFKKENEDYLIEDPEDIHYDSLEDIQFNYKYWEEICERTRTNICLFSGATSVFKFSKKDSEQYKFLEKELSLNYCLKRSANIFISCENLCLAAELNLQSYKIPEQKLRGSAVYSNTYYNLPCIGFDDLVITYNSNIIFCRSLIPSFYPSPGTQEELIDYFELDSVLTLNSNYTGCGQFKDKKNYEFADEKGLSELIGKNVSLENITKFIDEVIKETDQEKINHYDNLFVNNSRGRYVQALLRGIYKKLIRDRGVQKTKINAIEDATRTCAEQLRTIRMKVKRGDTLIPGEFHFLQTCETRTAEKMKLNQIVTEIDNKIKALIIPVIKARLGGTFFNSVKTRKEIINNLELDGNLNANKYRIAYKDIFLVSPHCNECSRQRLIGIINENNETRKNPLQEVHFVKDNEGRNLNTKGDKRKKTCIWCRDGECSKKENPENILYELDINLKIFAELLIKKNPDISHSQRNSFYESLNTELKMLIDNPMENQYLFIREKFLTASGKQQISEVTVEEYDKYANTDPSLYSYDKLRSSLRAAFPELTRTESVPTTALVSYSELPPPQLIRSLSQHGGTRKYRKRNKKQSKKKNPTNSKTRRHKKSKKRATKSKR